MAMENEKVILLVETLNSVGFDIKSIIKDYTDIEIIIIPTYTKGVIRRNMSKEKLIQLVEALNSAGIEFREINPVYSKVFHLVREFRLLIYLH